MACKHQIPDNVQCPICSGRAIEINTDESSELLLWKKTNKEKPIPGRLVLGRCLQLSYGGDLYDFYLTRIDADGIWWSPPYETNLVQPDEWAVLKVKAE